MSSKTAVVFDDNPYMADLLKDIMEEKQYKVTSFANPTLFLPQCDERRSHMGCGPCVDVIITDNEMPELTGLEFLKLLKKYECKIPNHRIAIISGNFSREQVTEAECLDYKVFHKPFLVGDILTWLEEIAPQTT